VVIYHPSDLDWADRHAALVSKDCKLYLQPEWDRAEQVTPLIVDKIKNDPRWQLSLQVHKYIQVP
jgi:organic radical activating enzyme